MNFTIKIFKCKYTVSLSSALYILYLKKKTKEKHKELISPPSLLLAHALKSKIKYQSKCSQEMNYLNESWLKTSNTESIPPLKRTGSPCIEKKQQINVRSTIS